MKKAAAVILCLAIAGAAGGGLYYYYVYQGNNGAVSVSDSADAVYVNSVSMLAGLGSGSGQLQRFAGIVEPQETWSAKLESDKTVKETYVEVGDTVKKGDKLFSYDTTEDENNLAKNEIDIEHTQNDILTEQKTLEQYQKNKAAATTNDEVLEWETQILSIENQIKQDEYELKEKALDSEKYQSSIDNADVFSQLEGVVKTVNSSSDSSTDSTSTSDAYITIMAVGEYRIKATLNEQNVDSVYSDEAMLVYSRVDSSQIWKGTISRIDTDNGTSNSSNSYYDTGSTATNSTNYAFYVELDTSEGLLLGQHVYLEEDVGQTEQKDGIWIPDYYFNQNEDGSWWVWAASSKNQLEQRTVVLGEHDDDMGTWEIKEGLTEEDYITQDQVGLEIGEPVTKIDYSTDSSGDSYYSEDFYSDDYSDDSYSDDFYSDDEYSDDFYSDDYSDEYSDDSYSDDSY